MAKNGNGSGDYEVGYGKPPKHTRWTKGQSGNPKGRKKGTRGLKTDLDTALKERLTIQVNGKRRKGTTQAHAMRALALRAASGDMRASKQLTDLVLAIFGPGDRGGEAARLSPLDQQLLDRWLDQQIGADPKRLAEASPVDDADAADPGAESDAS